MNTNVNVKDNVIYLSDIKNKTKKNDNLYTSHGKRKPQAAEPLSVEEVRQLKSYFLNKKEYRNYMLLTLGINNGRRCGDIIKLIIDDVYDINKGCVRDRFYIIEKKTKKTTRYGILINDDAKNAIELYLSTLDKIDPKEHLFKSRKHGYHLTIQSAWHIITEAKKQLDIKKKGGTHTLRKTFGMKFFNDSGRSPEALIMLMKTFNHNTPEQTLDYLTINQKKIDDVVSNFTW